MNRPPPPGSAEANNGPIPLGICAARTPTTRPALSDHSRPPSDPPLGRHTPVRRSSTLNAYPAARGTCNVQTDPRPRRRQLHKKSRAVVRKDSAATDLRKSIPWLLAGAGGLAVLIGAVVLIGNIARPGITGGMVLDVTKVQSGVLQTLSDPASGYGANTVTDVSCNGGRNPSAHQGTTFTCDAIVNGAPRHVTVVVSDDRGTYEIDSPR